MSKAASNIRFATLYVILSRKNGTQNVKIFFSEVTANIAVPTNTIHYIQPPNDMSAKYKIW
jgi:hypothetical protein